MPACVQGLKIFVKILRVPLTENLHQLHDPVIAGIMIPEAVEGSKSLSRVVELVDGQRRVLQSRQVRFQIRQLVSRLPAGGAEGVDVAQVPILTPGHFVAENGRKVPTRCRFRRPLALRPI